MYKVSYHKGFFKDLKKLCGEYSLLKEKFRQISTQIEIYPLNITYKKIKGYDFIYRYRLL